MDNHTQPTKNLARTSQAVADLLVLWSEFEDYWYLEQNHANDNYGPSITDFMDWITEQL